MMMRRRSLTAAIVGSEQTNLKVPRLFPTLCLLPDCFTATLVIPSWPRIPWATHGWMDMRIPYNATATNKRGNEGLGCGNFAGVTLICGDWGEFGLGFWTPWGRDTRHTRDKTRLVSASRSPLDLTVYHQPVLNLTASCTLIKNHVARWVSRIQPLWMIYSISSKSGSYQTLRFR